MEKTLNQFRKLLFFSGAFNIVIALPLIFPIVYERYFQLLWMLSQFFGLGGKELIPPEEGINALLINTAGIGVVLIGAIVIYSGFNPIERKFIPLANAIGRTLFAMITVYYIVILDIARLMLVIGGIDVLISAGFGYYLIKLNKLNLMVIMFRLMANIMFRERARKSAMQFSSGPGMSMIKLMRLAWKGQKHKHIKPKQVKQRIDQGNSFVFLDVRTKKSFDQGHVRNAVNLPFDELQKTKNLAFSKDAEIVVACYFGIKSRATIAILAERGYKNLTNMDGGLGAWDYEKERKIELDSDVG